MTSTTPLTTAHGKKPTCRDVDVLLAVHQVKDTGFAEIVQQTGEHLAEAARLGAPQGFALVQKLLRQGASFSRLAITRLVKPDEKGRLCFLRLASPFVSPEFYSHVARGVLSLQTAYALDHPLSEACIELEGTWSGKEIRARAVFLTGCILVIPDEDLDFEALLRVPGEVGFKAAKNGEPAPIGVVLVPHASSEQDRHQMLESVERARQIMQAALNRGIYGVRHRLVTTMAS